MLYFIDWNTQSKEGFEIMKSDKSKEYKEPDEIVIVIECINIENAKYKRKKKLKIDQQISKFASNDFVISSKVIRKSVDDFSRWDSLEVAVRRKQ